jgi:hypothetical protein
VRWQLSQIDVGWPVHNLTRHMVACHALRTPRTLEETCGRRGYLRSFWLALDCSRAASIAILPTTRAKRRLQIINGMGLSLSGWAIHVYFTSRRSEWLSKWPLVVELLVKSVVMAVVVAVVAVGLQIALYDRRLGLLQASLALSASGL